MTAQLDQIEARLERLLTAVERIAETTRQAQTAERQQQSIQQFVGILAKHKPEQLRSFPRLLGKLSLRHNGLLKQLKRRQLWLKIIKMLSVTRLKN